MRKRNWQPKEQDPMLRDILLAEMKAEESEQYERVPRRDAEEEITRIHERYPRQEWSSRLQALRDRYKRCIADLHQTGIEKVDAEQLTLAELDSAEQAWEDEIIKVDVAMAQDGNSEATAAQERQSKAEVREQSKDAARKDQPPDILSQPKFRSIVAKLPASFVKDRGAGEKPDWIITWRDAFLFAHQVATGRLFGPLYGTPNRVLTLFRVHGADKSYKQISDAKSELKRRHQLPQDFLNDLRNRDKSLPAYHNETILSEVERIQVAFKNALNS